MAHTICHVVKVSSVSECLTNIDS